MVNWTIKKHRHRWYAYGKKPKRYLGADGKPHRYVYYFKSKQELMRTMEKWKIIKEDNAYYVVIDGKFIYLDNECKSTIFPHPYFTLEAAQKNLERRQKQMEAESWKIQQEIPQVVDWSQPLQTFQNPPLKARLICDDRKGAYYKRIVLIEFPGDPDLEWIAQCEEDGNGVAVDSGKPIRIVNAPAKIPYGREDWERLSRVRLAAQGYQHMSVPVGCIDNLGVRIGERTLLFENAAKEFITMDGKELYK